MCTDRASITGKTPACVSDMKMRHMYNGGVAITLALLGKGARNISRGSNGARDIKACSQLQKHPENKPHQTLAVMLTMAPTPSQFRRSHLPHNSSPAWTHSCSAGHRGCANTQTITVTVRTIPPTWPDTHSIPWKYSGCEYEHTILHIYSLVEDVWYVRLRSAPQCEMLINVVHSTGDIIYARVLGQEIIILNSEEVAIALLEKHS